jgi:pyruvate dehydrogenase phosphatase
MSFPPLFPRFLTFSVIICQTCKHPSACYVKGRLQPTRAFGDFHLKNGREWHRSEWVPTRVRRPGSFTPPYITAKPSTNSVQLQAGETALVILATDGIWDELSSDVAARVAADAVAGGSVPPASAVMDAAFHRAAASSRMTVAQLKSVPPGSDRRRLVDDCTVVVGVFGSRSKL